MKLCILISAFGLLVLGGLTGWALAPTSDGEADSQSSNKSTAGKVSRSLRASVRPGGRTPGVDSMRAIRDSRNERERMLAAIELANSLPLEKAGQWLDEGLFSQREGYALTLFTEILKKRWRLRDPDGYLVWQLGHGKSVSNEEMARLLESNPDFLLAKIRLIQDPGRQSRALAILAKVRPDLALAELAKVNIAELKSTGTLGSIFKEMAKADLEILQSAVDKLPFTLQGEAQEAIYGQLLALDFSGTLTQLVALPNGLDVFMGNFQNIVDHRQSFLENYAGLPKAWQVRLESDTGYFTFGRDYAGIISTDWESYGLSAGAAGKIVGGALFDKARNDTAGALELFQNADLNEAGRRHFLDMLSWNRGEEIIEILMPHLEAADQDYITRKMENRPESFLPIPRQVTASEVTAVDITGMLNWSVGQKEKFQEDYDKMQGEERHRVTALLAGSMDLEQRFKAVNEILGNPEAQEMAGWNKDQGMNVIPPLAAMLLLDDTDRATRWVGGLPDGPVRTSAMKTLATNWMYYDPAAAETWVNSLPAAERDEVHSFLKDR